MQQNNLLAAVGPDFNAIQSQANVNLPSDIGALISKVLPYLFSIAAILLLIFLIMGGLQMMTSRGDPKAMQAAQGKITNALIGFVIVFFAFALVSIIGKVFGIDAFRPIFGF